MTTEYEMIRLHHQLEQHEFKEVLGVGDGQECMTCCRKRGGHKSWTRLRDWIELNSNMKYQFGSICQSCSTFTTLCTAAYHASLTFTNSQNLLKLMSFELMPSNHLILCRPLLLLASVIPSIRVLSNESILHIRGSGLLEFQLHDQCFQCIFRTDFL